ncbi:hypothetical protein ACCO45_003990 [Purpureocillium lilacinum]|uniref:Uncharacterized protein n=1 Tax=Purpureocillium lilacinum TaxID=33203 RepID=A0ACC4E1I5_PURLI
MDRDHKARFAWELAAASRPNKAYSGRHTSPVCLQRHVFIVSERRRDMKHGVLPTSRFHSGATPCWTASMKSDNTTRKHPAGVSRSLSRSANMPATAWKFAVRPGVADFPGSRNAVWRTAAMSPSTVHRIAKRHLVWHPLLEAAFIPRFGEAIDHVDVTSMYYVGSWPMPRQLDPSAPNVVPRSALALHTAHLVREAVGESEQWLHFVSLNKRREPVRPSWVLGCSPCGARGIVGRGSLPSFITLAGRVTAGESLSCLPPESSRSRNWAGHLAYSVAANCSTVLDRALEK